MRTRARPIVVSLLLLSGFTGLVYEFCWSKRLANLLGNTGQAHAIVLATFMGGLACGAWLFGRTADRSKRPLMVYAVLELGVGLYALVFPYVLDALGSVYLAVAPGLDGAPRTAARLVLAASALVVPTLLMGGTLPAMTRHMTQALHTARRELSILYGVNSLGAALGSLLAGMVLVPVQGIGASERMAAGLNLLLGAVALVLGRRAVVGTAEPAEAEASPSGPRIYGQAAIRAALVGTALAGFTAMLYEITWIRVLSVVLGGTSYAFTLILTAFILGISLGSFWLSTRPDVDALKLFSKLQLALAASVLAALPFYARLPYVFLKLNGLLAHTEETWGLYQVISFGFSCGVLLVPTFLLGASFPCAARVVMASVANVGQQLGRVYLWNTVGTVLGSLAGGLWLLPTIGLEGNFLMGLGCNLVAAGVALWATRQPGRPWARVLAPVLVGTLVVGVWAAGTRGWAQVVASSGRYREWKRSFASYQAFRAEVDSRSEVKFYQDDVFASVLVGEQSGDRRYLRINGKVDGSNGGDIDTQILAAHLGILTHPGEVKRVLLVGVGAGITAGSLLTHPIERLDVAEISPAVIEAATFFKADHHDAFSDPRCHVAVEDARTFLTLSKEKYDLIVSVPSNPWVSGVSGLFSQDFFQVARARLTEHGRIVQWIHTYESSDAMVQLVIRTLRDSFEHGTTWVGPEDLVLIASRTPQRFDVETMRSRMASEKVRSDLERIHMKEVTTLLARQVHSDQGQLAAAGQGPVNTDDHNRLEYDSPIAYFIAADVKVPDERLGPGNGQALELTRWLAANPLTAEQARDIHRSLSSVHPPGDALVRAAAESWRGLAPDSDDAATACAKASNAQGNPDAALAATAPRVAAGSEAPELVTQYLIALRGRVHRERAPFHPVEVEAALALGKRLQQAHPGDENLSEAVQKLVERL